MATKLSIKNMALQYLGEEPLASDGETTKAAVMAETFFVQALDEILSRHDWTFAKKRAAISYDVAAPAFGYSYKYLKPSDCIRISIINDNKDLVYSEELGYILMDDDTCEIVYVSRLTDYTILPPMFVAAMSALISSKMAYGLAGGDSKSQEMVGLYNMYYAEAISMDKNSGLGVVEEDEYGEGIGAWRNRGE